MADNPTFGAASLMGDTAAPASATMLDGTTVPLPAARGDMPAISVLRSDAMAEIAKLKGSDEFRRLLLSGNAEALAKVQQLERIIKTPTGTFYGGQQTPAQVDQHERAWRDFSDIGVAFGADVERQFRDGKPISESEHRQAQAKLAELKSDKEFVKRYFDGGRRERSIMQMLHRMLAGPVEPDKT
jgi:hypothetical protein